MHLVIDIGNTRVKTALFEQNEMKHYFVFDNITDFFQSDIFEKYTIYNCILVSVVYNTEAFVEILKKKVPVLVYTVNTPTPLKNAYQTINTLGGDRLVAAVAGNFLFPNQNVLVIDVGTCIKYNFINEKNEFMGGGISPGLTMRFKALNTFTARLPLLQVDESFDTLVGTNTNENILSGAQLGAVAEVDGFIEQYRLLFPEVKVVLTGGDLGFFEKRFKKAIFVDSFLILKGLNIILNHNLQTASL